jgi:hypothetical protein
VILPLCRLNWIKTFVMEPTTNTNTAPTYLYFQHDLHNSTKES